jgi:hypothetical protein
MIDDKRVTLTTEYYGTKRLDAVVQYLRISEKMTLKYEVYDLTQTEGHQLVLITWEFDTALDAYNELHGVAS